MADAQADEKVFRLEDFPVHEKLEKFMEDAKYGIYPLTAFAMAVPPPSKAEPSTPELHRSDSEKANEPEPQDEESRRVNTMQCDIQRLGEGDKGLSGQLQLRILLRMEDNMNRQLSCSISQDEDPEKLANELVQHRLYPQIRPLCYQGHACQRDGKVLCRRGGISWARPPPSNDPMNDWTWLWQN